MVGNCFSAYTENKILLVTRELTAERKFVLNSSGKPWSVLRLCRFFVGLWSWLMWSLVINPRPMKFLIALYEARRDARFELYSVAISWSHAKIRRERLSFAQHFRFFLGYFFEARLVDEAFKRHVLSSDRADWCTILGMGCMYACRKTLKYRKKDSGQFSDTVSCAIPVNFGISLVLNNVIKCAKLFWYRSVLGVLTAAGQSRFFLELELYCS